MLQPDINSKDYYAILGCERSADEGALKKAYRKLAVKNMMIFLSYYS